MAVVSLRVSLDPRLELGRIAGVSQVKVGPGQEGGGLHLALGHILHKDNTFKKKLQQILFS
jgi:hypothetical protein